MHCSKTALLFDHLVGASMVPVPRDSLRKVSVKEEAKEGDAIALLVLPE